MTEEDRTLFCSTEFEAAMAGRYPTAEEIRASVHLSGSREKFRCFVSSSLTGRARCNIVLIRTDLAGLNVSCNWRSPLSKSTHSLLGN
jgi:hypothetical protein